MPLSAYVCTASLGLTRRPRGGDTARSLKNVSSTPAPMLRSRVFCAPISGGSRSRAGRYRSMGVSGIRKDPDALTCVESTPTPFRVVPRSQERKEAVMPKPPSRRTAKTSPASAAETPRLAMVYSIGNRMPDSVKAELARLLPEACGAEGNDEIVGISYVIERRDGRVEASSAGTHARDSLRAAGIFLKAAVCASNE